MRLNSRAWHNRFLFLKKYLPYKTFGITQHPLKSSLNLTINETIIDKYYMKYINAMKFIKIALSKMKQNQ